MTYAKGTTVSIERSNAEVQKMLRRNGAASVMIGEEFGRRAFVAFQLNGRNVKLDIPMPGCCEDYRLTDTGRERNDDLTEKAFLQACRERWRAMVLLLKAKLEAIALGHSTVEREFLYDMMIPGQGGTFGEQLASGQLDKVLGTGKVPLLPEAM